MLTKISLEFIVFPGNIISILVLNGNERQDYDSIFTFKTTLHNKALKIMTIIQISTLKKGLIEAETLL